MLLNFTKQIFTLLFLMSSLSLFAQTPANNECSGAEDISALFGQAIDAPQTSALFDNSNATTEASDPASGYECFAEEAVNGSMEFPLIENTVWFSFVGDGNNYFIVTTQCNSTNYLGSGDTQMAIYSGACNDLTPVACNEDGPTATQTEYPAGIEMPTEDGVTYYVMIDGFNFGGSVSAGEFCIEVTQVEAASCDNGNGGTASGTAIVCFGETTSFTLTGVEIPNLPQSGFYWAVSSADISGSPNPNADPAFQGAFGTAAAPYEPALLNDGMQLPAGQYFFTAVTFADAEVDAMGAVDLATAGCVFTSESVPVTLAPEFTELAVSTTSTDDDGSGNGSATVTIGGGSTVYDIAWDNGETTPTISGLAAGDYTVTVTDLTGCVAEVVQTVTVAGTTSINKLDDLNGVEIFPNPANDFINVSFDFNESRDLTIRLTNTIGQVVRTQSMSDMVQGTLTLNVADLSEGIYLVQLTDGTEQAVQKIFIER